MCRVLYMEREIGKHSLKKAHRYIEEKIMWRSHILTILTEPMKIVRFAIMTRTKQFHSETFALSRFVELRSIRSKSSSQTYGKSKTRRLLTPEDVDAIQSGRATLKDIVQLCEQGGVHVVHVGNGRS